MSYSVEVKSKIKIFGGTLLRITHQSKETKTAMTFAVYIPCSINSESSIFTRIDSSAQNSLKYPSILYLSGLTCTDENVCQKSGVFKILSELQVALIAPDTSPRGAGIPGEDDSWDFGTGAGFYVDATNPTWSTNYRMYSYITKELTEVLEAHFPVLDSAKRSIMGHSMGGFGALYLSLTQPTLYKSVSAFAPICHPSIVPWGIKAFSGYLGEDNKASWAQCDPTELMRTMSAEHIPYDDILIDVGTADSFMHQLLPDDFKAAADAIGQKVTLRYQDGYDHSYYFISSFIEEHVRYHHSRLTQK